MSVWPKAADRRDRGRAGILPGPPMPPQMKTSTAHFDWATWHRDAASSSRSRKLPIDMEAGRRRDDAWLRHSETCGRVQPRARVGEPPPLLGQGRPGPPARRHRPSAAVLESDEIRYASAAPLSRMAWMPALANAANSASMHLSRTAATRRCRLDKAANNPTDLRRQCRRKICSAKRAIAGCSSGTEFRDAFLAYETRSAHSSGWGASRPSNIRAVSSFDFAAWPDRDAGREKPPVKRARAHQQASPLRRGVHPCKSLVASSRSQRSCAPSTHAGTHPSASPDSPSRHRVSGDAGRRVTDRG